VKRFYGVGERQFHNIFAKSAQRKGITGNNLLQTLELRIDNVLYRMNLAYSRAHARQMIRHGHIAVNGRKVTIPSYILRADDVVGFNAKSRENDHVKAMLADLKGLVEVPSWLLMEENNFAGKINALPAREDISIEVEEHLIVELYSK